MILHKANSIIAIFNHIPSLMKNFRLYSSIQYYPQLKRLQKCSNIFHIFKAQKLHQLESKICRSNEWGKRKKKCSFHFQMRADMQGNYCLLPTAAKLFVSLDKSSKFSYTTDISQKFSVQHFSTKVHSKLKILQHRKCISNISYTKMRSINFRITAPYLKGKVICSFGNVTTIKRHENSIFAEEKKFA